MCVSVCVGWANERVVESRGEREERDEDRFGLRAPK